MTRIAKLGSVLINLVLLVLAGCGGGSGGSSSNTNSTNNAKPISVQSSSYLNKNNIGSGPASLPGLPNAFALADFFQDGTESLVVHTLEYNISNPATYNNFGHIHFYQNQNGTWVDATSSLLTDTVGCLHPRKAVVADFNNDGKPDVYFACHGLDVSPFPGEQPHILLSQPNGTYTNLMLPFTCYCHSASAGDINGDGLPDILVTDTSVAHTPYFFINNGAGTFTQDFSRLPASLSNAQIYTAELIDFQNRGKFDVFLAGNEPGTTSYSATEFAPEIIPNDGSGKFLTTSAVSLYTTSFGLSNSKFKTDYPEMSFD